VTQRDTVASTDNVTFFGRTYQEALELTREARDYIAGNVGKGRSEQSADVRLASSCEEMRLTARMTQIMAWLLLQRAIHEGEVPRSEALKDENRLSGQETCLADPVMPNVELPPRLNDLMARSRNLYERIQRLDAMLDG
jgi:regulator of CtrA degradation